VVNTPLYKLAKSLIQPIICSQASAFFPLALGTVVLVVIAERLRVSLPQRRVE